MRNREAKPVSNKTATQSIGMKPTTAICEVCNTRYEDTKIQLVVHSWEHGYMHICNDCNQELRPTPYHTAHSKKKAKSAH